MNKNGKNAAVTFPEIFAPDFSLNTLMTHGKLQLLS